MIENPDHDRLFAEFDRLCDQLHEDQDLALRQLSAVDPAFAAQLAALLHADGPGHAAHARTGVQTRESAGRPLGVTAAVWKIASQVLDPDRAGTKVGRFVLLERIGEGGMGVVYAAFDSELERRVAVKLIRAPAPDRRERARLLREARAMARLAHPNVVTVFEAGTVGEGEDGEVFVAMEYVEGQTLRQWVRTAPSWQQIVAMYCGAAKGLAAAHAAGLVHRDFKPDNVLVGADGRPRVLDFGLARPGPGGHGHGPPSETADEAPQDLSPEFLRIDTVTATDTIVGTPAYMASEQITGQAVDHRTDQFALCVSLFEALYGMHPYQGDTIALQFEQVRTGSIAVPPASTRVPGWLRAVVVRGLHPQPNKRWPSMDALREALGNDPTRARTRLFAGLAGLAALGIATWGGSLMADDRSVPCLDAARHMKPVWDTPQRDAVRETLPTELARNVVPALDRYAQTWMKAHTEACEATQVRGEQSPALLDLRMRCLTRKKRELAAVVEAFAAADPNAVGHALERTRGLSSIAACADAEYLTSQREAPPRHSASSGAAS